MSQISPPIRIVLVAAVAFLAAWMMFLRPKTEEVPPPAPAASTAPAKQPGNTAQSAPGTAVQAAENAKATAESAAKARAGEAAEPAATAAPGAATTTAAPKPAPTAAQKLGVDADALATLPTGVRKEIEARKIVVLGFFNRDALDDQATRKQLDKVWTFHGRASVHTAPISDVQRYQVITRGVDVAQSPSIVVIDRDRNAQLLTGFVDHVAIEQAVMDAMRRSGMPIVKSHYLRQVNALCGSYSNALAASSGARSRFVKRLEALHAPHGYRSFKAGMVHDVRSADAAAGKRFETRARQHDMLACVYG
jgi:hypothetical protein